MRTAVVGMKSNLPISMCVTPTILGEGCEAQNSDPKFISLLQTIPLFSLVVFSLSLKRSQVVLVVFHGKPSKSDRVSPSSEADKECDAPETSMKSCCLPLFLWGLNEQVALRWPF
ncbi:unnamed protein product [Caretta caretta]